MRTRYLLCYDVRNDARLRRTAKVAEAFGYRLQYSVFVCDLSPVERARLERDLNGVLDLRADTKMLIDLGPPGPPSRRHFHWLSQPVQLYDPGQATVV